MGSFKQKRESFPPFPGPGQKRLTVLSQGKFEKFNLRSACGEGEFDLPAKWSVHKREVEKTEFFVGKGPCDPGGYSSALRGRAVRLTLIAQLNGKSPEGQETEERRSEPKNGGGVEPTTKTQKRPSLQRRRLGLSPKRESKEKALLNHSQVLAGKAACLLKRGMKEEKSTPFERRLNGNGRF